MLNPTCGINMQYAYDGKKVRCNLTGKYVALISNGDYICLYSFYTWPNADLSNAIIQSEGPTDL